MSQSNVIAGFMVFAFIVFITVRGELPVYMGLLLADPSGGTAPAPAPQPQTTPQKVASNAPQISAGDAAKLAMDFLPALV